MARASAVAAENVGQYAALGAGILNLGYFSAAAGERIDLSGALSSFADVDPVLKIQMGNECRADIVSAERSLDNPCSGQRMLPLRRYPSDAISDKGGPLGAIEFTSDNVAAHASIFPDWGV